MRLDRRAFLLSSGGVATASLAGEAGGRTDDEGDAETDTVAVVSQHHLATEAGLEVLEVGDTAADAAVAVASALSVVEPWFSSALGGGTWALYYDAESDGVTSVDGVGPVGSEASVDDFEDRAGDPGMHQAIVPGAWDGWMLWLDRYGTLDLDEVLTPAIELAREGYPASPGMERWLQRDGDPYVLGGNTGVDTQPQGQAQQFLHVVEFGHDAQAAISHPRFVSSAFPSTQHPYEAGNVLEMEAGYPSETIEDLEDRGHDVEVVTGGVGTANVIVVDGEEIDVGAESRSETATGEVRELDEA